MKVLQIGCGGIGSFFIEELCKCIEQEQINPNVEITIADNDIVELEQMKYQNFTYAEAGLNKAQALAKRFKMFGIVALKKRITKVDLKPYDFIVLCVDNEPTREMVINYCFDKKKEFLDLRARGRGISAFPKLAKREDNLKWVSQDNVCYSCQDKERVQQGLIDKGNKVIALIGVQMVLNYLRGMNNKIVNLVI